MATDYAKKMAAAVQGIAPELRKQGFKKQRNTFNREAEDNMIQVISFQMGQHMPPGTPEVPGVRENLYGTFTINLGLYFGEVAGLDNRSRPKFVRDVDCHLRQRLGLLLPDRADTWWHLSPADDELAALVHELISEHGLRFLNRFDSREAVLSAWHSGESAISDYTTLPPFVVAVLHTARGEKGAAEEILGRELESLGLEHPKAKGLLGAAEDLGLDVRRPGA